MLILSDSIPETKPKEVEEYFEEILNIETKYEKMKIRKNLYKSCFKLFVPYESRENVMNSEMWKKGLPSIIFFTSDKNSRKNHTIT